MTITTFRQLKSARRGDVIDYTRFRRGVKIVTCRECGKKGFFHSSGLTSFVSVTHIGHVEFPPWNNGRIAYFSEEHEVCYFNAPDLVNAGEILENNDAPPKETTL